MRSGSAGGCPAPLPEPRRHRIGEPDPVLTEIATQQLGRRGAGVCDAEVGLEQHDGCPGRLVQRERLAEAPSGLTGAVELYEVRVQSVEDGTVARAEVASAAVQD